MKEKKYVVLGGDVISRHDGDRHFISTRQLCDLYGVDPEECILVGAFSNFEIKETDYPNLPRLRPQYSGDYSLPAQPNASSAAPNPQPNNQ